MGYLDGYIANDLVKKLQSYDALYYNLGGSSVSDREYDDLKDKLRKLNPSHPYLKSIGSKVEKGDVSLPHILGSLDKRKPEDIDKWFEKYSDDTVYCVSEKLDGASVVCVWTNGKIEFAATRGDGKIGQDITIKLQMIAPEISFKGRLELRGKLIMRGGMFRELGFKNRRGGVVGIVNREDINDIKHVTPIFYEILDGAPENMKESERLKFIQKLGLLTPIFTTGTRKELRLNEFLVDCRENADYDMDGLVICPETYELESVMIPDNKIAYKVNQDAIPVTVIGFEWKTSRMGKVKPVVLLQPTDIGGVTIGRTSGFHAQYVELNNLGIGSTIALVRAGDVIPYMDSVIETTKADIPKVCPDCNTELIWEGVDVVCTNEKCPGRMIYSTAYFLKKMGVESMSVTTLKNLGVTSIEELYELDESDIMDLEGFGLKRATEIMSQLEKCLKTKPHTLLAAFGMPMIGSTNAKLITAKWTFDQLWNLTEEHVGIGVVASKKFVENINKFRGLYNFLLVHGLEFVKEKESKIKGMIFTLTGAGNLRRDQYINMIEDFGASVKSASSKTNILVTDDPNSNSTKMKTARKFGTKIISYSELEDMLK